MGILYIVLNLVFALVLFRIYFLPQDPAATNHWFYITGLLAFVCNSAIFVYDKKNQDPLKQAHKYLTSPLPLSDFSQKYQLSEAEIRRKIGLGELKAYEFKNVLFIDDIPDNCKTLLAPAQNKG